MKVFAAGFLLPINSEVIKFVRQFSQEPLSEWGIATICKGPEAKCWYFERIGLVPSLKIQVWGVYVKDSFVVLEAENPISHRRICFDLSLLAFDSQNAQKMVDSGSLGTAHSVNVQFEVEPFLNQTAETEEKEMSENTEVR